MNSDILSFDTHRFVKRMIGAGMHESIAESLAEEQISFLNINVEIKSDIAENKMELIRVDERITHVDERITRTEVTFCVMKTKPKYPISVPRSNVANLRSSAGLYQRYWCFSQWSS